MIHAHSKHTCDRECILCIGRFDHINKSQEYLPYYQLLLANIKAFTTYLHIRMIHKKANPAENGSSPHHFYHLADSLSISDKHIDDHFRLDPHKGITTDISNQLSSMSSECNNDLVDRVSDSINMYTCLLNVDPTNQKMLIEHGEHSDVYKGSLQMVYDGPWIPCAIKWVHAKDISAVLSLIMEAHFLDLLQHCPYIITHYGFYTDKDMREYHDKRYRCLTISVDPLSDPNLHISTAEQLLQLPYFQPLPKEAFLLLNYYEQGTLHQYCSRKHARILSNELFYRWMYQLSLALAAMESRSIIHWDIKPQNILLKENLDICLGDFNSASMIQSSSDICEIVIPGSPLAEAMMTGCGTQVYTAPEILKRTNKYTNAVDIYSMGVTMYYLLTGIDPYYKIKFPIQIVIGATNGFFKCGYNEDLVSSDPEVFPLIDSATKDIVYRCTSVDASKRPTIGELLSFFQNKLRSL